MNELNAIRKLSRREFLKLGLGSLGAWAALRLLRTPIGQSGDVAVASPKQQAAIVPDLRIAGTDGWAHLPGRIPIAGTVNQYYSPDNWAPGYDPANPEAGLTTYMFGFTNLTPLVNDVQVQNRKMKAQTSAPLFWVDEGTEYFVEIGNLGLQMRPDLVDSHTLHWHGFRNAWPVFDGEPHSALAVPIGRTQMMYYKPFDPGTYMYHCHFEETEHVHMGMTGAVFVRPAQNQTPITGSGTYKPGEKYVYNDGDGSTAYEREFIILLTDVWAEAHWDDAHIQLPDWTDFRPDFYLMNGRVYPDTIAPKGQGFDPDTGDYLAPAGRPDLQYQPYSSKITCNSGDRVLLRLMNLTFGQQTLALPGLKMKVIGKDATLLRGLDGTNLFQLTNNVYFGSGQTIDAIFTAPSVATPTRYLLFNRNYDRLSNAGYAGFGGQMTEIWVYPAGTLPAQTEPNG